MNIRVINKIIMANIVIFAFLLFSAVSATELDLSVKYGLGENANDNQTKSYVVKAELTKGLFHVGLSHREGRAKDGITDDVELSLIDGSWTQIHIGVSSGRGTKLDFALSEKWWIVDLCHRGEPVRWGVYAIGCMNHRNTKSEFKSRKTTGFEVGLGKKITRNQRFEFTVFTSNSTKREIKDEATFLLGSQWRF